jgi:hypothetical protein
MNLRCFRIHGPRASSQGILFVFETVSADKTAQLQIMPAGALAIPLSEIENGAFAQYLTNK